MTPYVKALKQSNTSQNSFKRAKTPFWLNNHKSFIGLKYERSFLN